MPLYEVLCITSKTASQHHLISLFKKCSASLAKRGGVFRGIENLGVRPLAHRYRAHGKQNDVGRFLRLRVQANPSVLSALQHRLKLDEGVLRTVAIKQKEMAPKGEPTKIPWERPLPFDEATGSALRTFTNMDYEAAKLLLQYGVLTREQIQSIPTHSQVRAATEKIRKMKLAENEEAPGTWEAPKPEQPHTNTQEEYLSHPSVRDRI